MQSLPHRLRSDVAQDFCGCIHFLLAEDDNPEWTVEVANGLCRIDRGLRGAATCVVAMKATTFVDVELGKMSPITAFLSGKLKVSNVEQMRRYNQIFYKLYDAPTGDTDEK